MAKKEKLVSVNQIDKMIAVQKKENSSIKYLINEEETIELSVKYTLDKDSKIKFISDVVDGVFSGDNYMPYFKHDLTNIAILEYFTNVKVDTGIEKLLELTSNTDIIEQVTLLINTTQLTDMKIVIDDMIEFRKQSILSNQKQRLDEAIDGITELAETFKTVIEQYKDINQNEILDLFKKVANKDDGEMAKIVLDYQEQKKNENENKSENSIGIVE